MVGLGSRLTIERVRVGNSRPKAARACALLDPSGFVVVPYNARAVPTVTCKAGEFCAIELEPGEFVKEKNGWYLADEVRWMAYPLEYGEGERAVQTILLKPLDSLPSLRTNIQIGT